jgi:hypothetical protein
MRLVLWALAIESNCAFSSVSPLGAEELLHVDMFAHNKSGNCLPRWIPTVRDRC